MSIHFNPYSAIVREHVPIGLVPEMNDEERALFQHKQGLIRGGIANWHRSQQIRGIIKTFK